MAQDTSGGGHAGFGPKPTKKVHAEGLYDDETMQMAWGGRKLVVLPGVEPCMLQ